eukprot:CAMPEP_0174749070 /NCGR_PEP_ID=MMETSP1094-20130205/94931_1 /TAXON_ID=156173 /ORGANISM="Chrysochromulina brevifilum, Strain UTEX LB 985" /LENGTH=69 /DNA_ID=CAMNT_0015954223 /DNA_START=768 /DNA_END=978 /DNA_ORIENTATION=+
MTSAALAPAADPTALAAAPPASHAQPYLPPAHAQRVFGGSRSAAAVLGGGSRAIEGGEAHGAPPLLGAL